VDAFEGKIAVKPTRKGRCAKQENGMTSQYAWKTRVEAKIPGIDTGIEIKKTLCVVCGNQCGIDAYVKGGRLIKVEGTQENPVNQGKLCVKGAANRQWIYNPDRIQTPLIRTGERGDGQYAPISWEEALDRIASHLSEIKAQSGPESVVFYAGFPKVMRPFLKRLAHGFGSPNYCTESSTCSVAPNMSGKLNFGYELGAMGGAQVMAASCILNWATDPLNSSAPSGVHFLNALDRGTKLIDVGPLKSLLSERADIHLRLRPGTSGALALGMARVIIEEGLYDRDFVKNWTLGFDEYRAYAKTFTPEVVEGITGVAKEKIIAAARLYATAKPATITTSSNTTTHHTNGVQNHRAITALIGLTGNFDRLGGNLIIPRSYFLRATGLSHRGHEFEQVRPWEKMAPRIGQEQYPVWCRLTSQAQAMDLPDQIQNAEPYPIRAVLGFGLNHRMWPSPDYMKASLHKLDFFVNVDLFFTESAKLADIILPACSSFERSELFFTPPNHAIWTEPVIAPVGRSRPDVDIIVDLAKRMTPEDRLMAQGHEACLEWIFAPAGLAIAELKKLPGGMPLQGRPETPYEKYRATGFPTPSGKMEFTSQVLKEFGINPLPLYKEPELSPVSTPEVAKAFPLVLTTGARLSMYAHSRTFRVPWLRKLRHDPAADINPLDAKVRGIESNEWVLLSTPKGAIRVRANVTDYVPPGVVNMIYGFPGADVNDIIDPDYLDPISGYPGFKSLLCDVKKP
jgi:anaerobic selenocysteine-containing dehydrogenase